MCPSYIRVPLCRALCYGGCGNGVRSLCEPNYAYICTWSRNFLEPRPRPASLVPMSMFMHTHTHKRVPVLLPSLLRVRAGKRNSPTLPLAFPVKAREGGVFQDGAPWRVTVTGTSTPAGVCQEGGRRRARGVENRDHRQGGARLRPAEVPRQWWLARFPVVTSRKSGIQSHRLPAGATGIESAVLFQPLSVVRVRGGRWPTRLLAGA